MRYGARVDATHRAISVALTAVGATVEYLRCATKGVPDLLVGYRGVTYLIEVKSGKRISHRRDGPAEHQRLWHEQWRGGKVSTVESIDEALAAIGVVTQ